jgi:hypothetical protein
LQSAWLIESSASVFHIVQHRKLPLPIFDETIMEYFDYAHLKTAPLNNLST